jgi:hypothetical protein
MIGVGSETVFADETGTPETAAAAVFVAAAVIEWIGGERRRKWSSRHSD